MSTTTSAKRATQKGKAGLALAALVVATSALALTLGSAGPAGAAFPA
jgi:hypothetical protein